MGFHIAVVAALIIVPLYSSAKIHLNEYQEVPLVAPHYRRHRPPPPASRAIALHITITLPALRERLGYRPWGDCRPHLAPNFDDIAERIRESTPAFTASLSAFALHPRAKPRL
jgi:hypothetical protein